MAHINWDNKYSVDVAEFDEHHKRLFSLVNRLHDAIINREGKQVIGEVIYELADYTHTHFGREEQRMAAAGYPDLAEHKRKHNEFVSKVLRFKEDHDKGKLFLSTEIIDFLKDWLVNHICETDKAYGPFLNTVKQA